MCNSIALKFLIVKFKISDDELDYYDDTDGVMTTACDV